MARTFRTAATVAVTLTATALLPVAPAAAGVAWALAPPVPTPTPADATALRDVTVLGPADVWAVGAWQDVTAQHTLAAHWDGAGWTVAPTPDPPSRSTVYGLDAVDAVARDDVWAVGDATSLDDPAAVVPLFVHYDGTAWTERPGPPGVAGTLADIDLLTADEGWAVGTAADRPLLLHRTAGQWVPVPAPVLSGSASLASVFTASADDAWAAGTRLRAGRPAALLLHWDGRLWTEVQLPGAGASSETLASVAAVSPTEVWTVGTMCGPVLPSTCGPRALHLVGGVWRVEGTGIGATLTEVVPLSPTDVWIFGQGTSAATALDRVEHWDGTRFTPDSSVPPVVVNNHPASALSLAAAAGDRSTGTLWAVGWVQLSKKTSHAIYR